ncbi:hypothetical protein Tco_1024791 [Tanacetum coccineum]
MNELNELRDQAYENSLIYKEKTKKIHDSKIKNRVFNVSDRVILFNSRSKIFSGKLKTRWTRLFTVTQVFSYGTVELSSTNGPNFKVNGYNSPTNSLNCNLVQEWNGDEVKGVMEKLDLADTTQRATTLRKGALIEDDSF